VHGGRKTLTIGGGPCRRTMAGSECCGGNGGAADARIGVVSKEVGAHATLVEFSVGPGSSRRRLAMVRLLMADAVASDTLLGGAALMMPQSRSNEEEGVVLTGTRSTAQGSMTA
jgi:hypothetical protein